MATNPWGTYTDTTVGLYGNPYMGQPNRLAQPGMQGAQTPQNGADWGSTGGATSGYVPGQSRDYVNPIYAQNEAQNRANLAAYQAAHPMMTREQMRIDPNYTGQRDANGNLMDWAQLNARREATDGDYMRQARAQVDAYSANRPDTSQGTASWTMVGNGDYSKPTTGWNANGTAQYGGGSVWSGTGGASGVGGSGNMSPSTENPFMAQQVAWLRQNSLDDYNRNTAPRIAQTMASTGGYGGSRMGVLEANVNRDRENSLNSAITNMLGNNWQADQNRYVSSRDNNRQLDLQQQQIGANLYGQAMGGMAGMNSGAYGVGQQEQDAAWRPIQNATGTYSPFSGLGQTTTQTQNRDRSGDWQQALGAIMGGLNLYNSWGR